MHRVANYRTAATVDDVNHALRTLRTLNYGNYGIVLIIWVMDDLYHQQYLYVV